MYKKFLNAILFGALILGSAGTITSCKDYDDEIDEINQKLNTLSSKDELAAQISSLTSTISAAQSAAAQASTEAANALTAAKEAAAQAEQAATNAGQATGQAAEAITGAKAAATTAEAATKAANDAAAKAAKAAEDAAKAVAAGADATKAIGEAKAASEAAKKAAEEAKAAVEAAKAAAAEAGASAAAKAVADAQADIAKAAAAAAEAAAKTAAAEAAKAQVAELAKRVEALEKGEKGTIIEKLQNEIAEVKKQIAGASANLVTEIDVWYRSAYWDDNEVHQQDANITDMYLTFSNVKEKDNKFGPKGQEITFVDGKDVATPTGVIVRVVPSTATLTPEMISVINSTGADVMDQVEVVSVKPYTKLMTRGSDSGLWEIEFALKKYDKDAFAAIQYAKPAKQEDEILYAIAVTDVAATDEAAARMAVSDYVFGLEYCPGLSANELNYKVDGTPVADLHNRFSMSEEGISTEEIEDYIWSGDAAVKAILKTQGKTQKNILTKAEQEEGNDDRQSNPIMNVKVGVPFTVELQATDMSDNTDQEEEYSRCTSKVMPRAFYVALDESHAVESNPSEINAWTSYEYDGLNVLVDPAKGNKLQITINSEKANGDYIGFRVYAVNWDGTLVDPDGRAFYVYVADDSTTGEAAVQVKPKKHVNDGDKVNSTAEALTIKTSETYKVELTKIYDQADGRKANIASQLGLTIDNFKMVKGNTATPIADVVALKPQLAAGYTKVRVDDIVPRNLEDGHTYEALLNIYKEVKGGQGESAQIQKVTVQTVTVRISKTLPTFADSGVYPFTNILQDGRLLKVYPKIDLGEGMFGYDMDNVWHGLDEWTYLTELDYNPMFGPTVTTDEFITESTTSDDKNIIVAPGDIMKVNNPAYLTKYPMQFFYDFGLVSTEDDVEVDEYGDPVLDADGNPVLADTYWTEDEPFTLVLGNYVDDCVVKFKSDVSLYYPGVVGEEDFISLSKVDIKDWYNRAVELATKSGMYFNDYASAVTFSLITTNVLGKEEVDEYYSVELDLTHKSKDSKGKEYDDPSFKLTTKSTASQGVDVPTKIRMTITDIYGGTVKKDFSNTFTMKFKK